MSEPAESRPEQPEAPAGGGDAKIAFEHFFFNSFEDAYFRMSEQTDTPVFVLNFGDQDAALPFPGLKREFGIADDSPDGKMLELIAEALDYVNILRLGDPVPKEVLTGEVSFEVSERHRQIALSRLSMQLVSWISGEELAVGDGDDLLKLAADPETRREIKEAFAEAAERLGLGRDRKEEVIGHLQEVAEDLAHIEALRDLYRDLRAMEKTIKGLGVLYEDEFSVAEIAGPVAELMVSAVADFRTLFKQADSLSADISLLLRNLDTQRQAIRAAATGLFRRFRAWEDILGAWRQAKVERDRSNVILLGKTYRFLAPRYMKVDEWVLMTSVQTPVKPAPPPPEPKQKHTKKRDTQMVW